MEKRRLQATGGSSLTLTLPKSWLQRWKLKSKDQVLVSTVGSSLIIKPDHRSYRDAEITIALDGQSTVWILREIIAAYIAGADRIVLSAQRIMPEQNMYIRQTIQQLFGFEILEESSKSIVAHSVADDSLFPVADNIRRAYTICRSMLEDALRAVEQNDKDLARDVILRDHEVNKLVYGVERRFTQVLSGRSEGNAIELNYHCNVAMQLERIGDRAVIISKLASSDQITLPALSEEFTDIRGAITELLANIDQLLQHPTMEYAHAILDKNQRLEPLMYSNHHSKHTYTGAVIEDSFDRSRGRLMNIAELTIDYLMQKR